MTSGSPHEAARQEFRAFVEAHVAPQADERHRTETTRPETVRALAERGYLGVNTPERFGCGGRDMVTVGLLAGELGRGCSSIRSLFTVHTMVAQAVARWGTKEQKATWLPRLARGEQIGAFALSEPEAGSDAAAIATIARPDGDAYVLDGHKVWITYGELADVFLVFARAPEGPTAFLVERDRPGLRTEPIFGMFGIRGSMTAKVYLDGCRVPRANLVARPGLGVSHVAGAALDLGRYTVAWGCVGILDACLAATLDYTGARRQFGQPLKEHQLVRRLVSDMVTDAHAARLLCTEAGRLKDAGDPGALAATSIAKYFASTAATRAAGDALQLHGANGCSGAYPLQRYLGDAKIAEVIEGSTQIQQIVIAEYGYQNRAGERGASGPASVEKGT
jgi:hypothetical protein